MEEEEEEEESDELSLDGVSGSFVASIRTGGGSMSLSSLSSFTVCSESELRARGSTSFRDVGQFGLKLYVGSKKYRLSKTTLA